ncbi:MAG: AsnC family protein [Magnetovibrio sp.]|nr:AsnC family protein [Magnetovibrio sp.]
MDIDNEDLALVETICGGLPLDPRPYHVLGERIGLSEDDVIKRLQNMIESGVIRRFGVIVQHRRLGYTANGMSVWNIPDERVREIGERMGHFPYVTLCYHRPRNLPEWPYNLFAMVHGSDRDTVQAQVNELANELELLDVEHDVLFSRRQFKQCGARYGNKRRGVHEQCKFD